MRISRLLAFLVVVIGCGGGDGPTYNNGGNNNDGPVASVQINSSTGAMTIGQSRNLTATLRNATNGVLSGRSISWSVVPATGVVSLSATSGSQVTVTATGVGSATVTATSEGKSDDETITVEESAPAPSQANVSLGGSSFNPSSVTIARNGTVTWSNGSGIAHTLEFQSPPAPVNNVSDFGAGQEHSRTFGTAGTYNYLCSLHAGMTGTVIVQP